jgi:hypothetical protein
VLGRREAREKRQADLRVQSTESGARAVGAKHDGWSLGAIAPTGTTKAKRRYRDHLWTFAVHRSPVDV